MSTPGEWASRYLDRIIKLAGGREPGIHLVDETQPELHLPRVTAFCFPDLPEAGLMTGFTYGLSLVVFD